MDHSTTKPWEPAALAADSTSSAGPLVADLLAAHPADPAEESQRPSADADGAIDLRLIRDGAPTRRLRIHASRCTLGSGEGCTVRLSDPALRPLHAVIVREAGRVSVRGYTVTIEVNGQRVMESALKVGDRFHLGQYGFEILALPHACSGHAAAESIDALPPTDAPPALPHAAALPFAAPNSLPAAHQRDDSAEQAIAELQQQIDSLTEQLATLAAAAQAQRTQASEEQAKLQDLLAAKEQAEAASREAEATSRRVANDALRQRDKALTQRSDAIDGEQAAQAKLRQVNQRIQQLSAELSAAAQRSLQSESRCNTLREQLDDLQERLTAAEQELAARPSQQQHDELHQQLAETQQQLAQGEAELTQLREQLDHLRSEHALALQHHAAQAAVTAAQASAVTDAAEPAEPNTAAGNDAGQSPATPSQAAANADDEESIEAYMRRLLQRSGLMPEHESLPPHSAAGRPEATSPELRLQPQRHAEPAADDGDAIAARRRQVAQQQERLSALRDLAREPAAEELRPRTPGQMQSSVVFNLLQATVVLTCGLVFFYCAQMNPALKTVWYTASVLACGLAMFSVADLVRRSLRSAPAAHFPSSRQSS